MENDKHYFFEGLFIVVLALAGAGFALWISNYGHRDDIVYRIHFAQSVGGLALGDPVKVNGVDMGTVKTMVVDAEDPKQVTVDIRMRKEAPIKTDTKAQLKLKGFTGVVYIELSGGTADAQNLVAATPAGSIPEIPSEKSALAEVLDQLPTIVHKFSGVEDQVKKVATDVGAVTGKLRDKFAPDDKSKSAPQK